MTEAALHDQLRGRLVVSCQARKGSPLSRPSIIAALARAAELGGACGVRVCGAAEIRAVRRAVQIPIIGLLKRSSPKSSVYITPTLADALAVINAGADLVALDATSRPRPDGGSLTDLLEQIKRMGGVAVADVDSVAAAIAAAAAGADYIATTLSGYTSPHPATEPDIELVADITAHTNLPVIAEGRYRELNQIRAAFDAGAHAVVVGNAITDPIGITERLVMATPAFAREHIHPIAQPMADER
jgi:N-acylglucosamine-6-phosphate 2-epimerase